MSASRPTRSSRSHRIAPQLCALLAILAAALWPLPGVAAGDLDPQADLVNQALGLLAADASTANLPKVIAANHVRISFMVLPPGTFGQYVLGQHLIAVDRTWSSASAVDVAAVLAHEATHASDDVSGYLSTNHVDSCVGSEVHAFRASAQFWTDYYGPQGKPDPQDEIEQQMNLLASREATDPAGLATIIRQTYHDQCGS